MCTREDVIEVLKSLPDGAEVTTSDVCVLLSCRGPVSERQVRACMSWLVLGGLVEDVRTVQRKDIRGRKYLAKVYRWTGKSEIRRVHRDPEKRRSAREAERAKEMAELHKFLRGPWK